MTDTGHNSIDPEELRLLVERIERLAEQRKNLSEDIGDIYRECKSRGYNRKGVRKLIAIRAMDPEKRREQDEIVAAYERALAT